MKPQVARLTLLTTATLVLLCSVNASAQRGTSLRGQVKDQFGAVIVGAPVMLIDGNGKGQVMQTDDRGAYHFNNLASGVYTLRVAQAGFATYDQTGLNIGSGITTHDVKLSVTIETQRVTVDDTRALTADPNNNKSARVLSGKELNALSDDPDELAAELNALAGPAAGPSGTQVVVDGFTAGPVLPDKQTISQIVINQNPFSAEYDRIGFGNIQVFTKPGTGKLHGGAGFTFSDAIFNSRNPYAAALFFWPEIHRQVCVEGSVEQLPDTESDAYFASRPRGHQLSAWASEQSEEAESREILEQRLDDFTRRFEGGPVPRPHSWGGFLLRPERFEFWQGRSNRLHDRIELRREGSAWMQRRLQP